MNKPTYTGYRYFIINKNDKQKKNITQQLYKDTENSFAMKNLHLKLLTFLFFVGTIFLHEKNLREMQHFLFQLFTK